MLKGWSVHHRFVSSYLSPWAPPIKLVDAEVRWFDLWSSWVPPNDTFLCVHLRWTGQVEWYSKDLSSWKTSWQFANKQRLLEHRKHLFMVVVIQEPHLCRFHVLPLHVVIQGSHYKIHLGTMPNCFGRSLAHHLSWPFPPNKNNTSIIAGTEWNTLKDTKIFKGQWVNIYCNDHLMSSYTWTYTAIFNPSTPADLEDPLRKELRSNWWCAGWSRTPGFHVIPAMSLLRFFITNASPNRVPTTRLVVPLATWLQSCDVKY